MDQTPQVKQLLRDLRHGNPQAIEGILEMMTDDVVFLNPGEPPFGRDRFSANYSAAQQQIRFHCSSDLEEVVVAGDVAYTRSRDALSVTPLAGGKETQFAGHRITIYRKQPDGRWLLARDAHTLLPVAESSS